MRALREQVQQVAPHDAPILLLGEPGTGREAFARYIHSLSARSGQPLVVAVAGSLDEESRGGSPAWPRGRRLVEAGLLEQADGGTLYINGLEDLCPGPAPDPRRRSRVAAMPASVAARRGP